MDIIENNKLIAEFMGSGIYSNDKRCLFVPIHGICRHDTIDLGMGKILKYHKSHDWLMPVVEKITAIKYDGINPLIEFTIAVNPTENVVLIRSNVVNGLESLELFGGKLIDSIYKACIHFITWHNENAK